VVLRYSQFISEKKDPCWKGYRQIGTKYKKGRKVPRCVPVNESSPMREITPDQKRWLDSCTRPNWYLKSQGKKPSWELNPQTGLVDVHGDFILSKTGIRDFMGIEFGDVFGNFFASYNNLESLEGAPRKVGFEFHVQNNNLRSLKGSPREVGGSFNCSDNDLDSLEGFPEKIGGSLMCGGNNLTSFKGVPKGVTVKMLYCSYNPIVSLEGVPVVLEQLICSGGPISGTTLRGLYAKMMKEGKSFQDAVASYWRHIKPIEDKIILAEENPKLSQEDKVAYRAMSINKRAI
jgi:hypothetical protein